MGLPKWITWEQTEEEAALPGPIERMRGPHKTLAETLRDMRDDRREALAERNEKS